VSDKEGRGGRDLLISFLEIILKVRDLVVEFHDLRAQLLGLMIFLWSLKFSVFDLKLLDHDLQMMNQIRIVFLKLFYGIEMVSLIRFKRLLLLLSEDAIFFKVEL
jgi:hypothetical protein